jgi:hypothetical protein
MLEAISSFDDLPPVVSSTPDPAYEHKLNVQSLPRDTTSTIHITTPSPFSAHVQPNTDFTNPNPQLNFGVSPSFVPQNNWDLNNMLLLQMGYARTNLGDHMDMYSNDNLYSAGIIAPEANMIEGIKTLSTSTPGPNMATDEVLSLWSDFPATFRYSIITVIDVLQMLIYHCF